MAMRRPPAPQLPANYTGEGRINNRMLVRFLHIGPVRDRVGENYQSLGNNPRHGF